MEYAAKLWLNPEVERPKSGEMWLRSSSDFPVKNSFVVCRVRKIMDFGVVLDLEEYPERNGFIHISEISSGWVKRITDFVREGQRTVCKVIDVDRNRNRIDLSLKNVSAHQKREKIEEWKNDQKGENLFRIVAEKLEKDIDDCYESFGKDLIEDFGSMYLAFESASADEPDFTRYDGFWVKTFVEIAKENIEISYVKIKGKFTLTSFASDGVERVKSVLNEIEKNGVEVRYAGAPIYSLSVESEDYKTAEEIMKKGLKAAAGIAKKLDVESNFEKVKA